MFKAKRKNRHSIAPFLFLFFFLLVFSASSYILFENYFFRNPLYLSPVVNQKEPLVDRMENLLMKKDIQFTQITASDSSYLVFLKDGGQVILPLVNDGIKKKIYSLQLMLKQFTIEGKRFKRIDFRFDKPTILF